MSMPKEGFSISVFSPQWPVVYTIPKGTVLVKGRRHWLYKDIMKATQNITHKCGCYSWMSKTVVYYCGSFTEYSSGRFKTNLQARIHNYFQNHRQRADTGRKNTNLMVFEKINAALKHEDVHLSLFTFESLDIDNCRLGYDDFSQDPDLVHAVEELLICSYRRRHQCAWNRT